MTLRHDVTVPTLSKIFLSHLVLLVSSGAMLFAT